MSVHFFPLRIKKITEETADCISLSFDVPRHLTNHFNFTQGQSLTMRASINDQEVRRTYSICSSPLDNELKVAIRKIDGGLFSRHAFHELKAGDELEVMQPVGNFYTKLDPSQQKNYLAFAAGSGITPVLSLIKTTLATEPLSSFTLVYGNRSRASIIFFEELEGLKNKYINRFNLVHILSRERMDSALNYGRIDLAKMEELNGLLNYRSFDEFFLCGPEAMIFTAKEFLETMGVASSTIHFELFTTPGVNAGGHGNMAKTNQAEVIKNTLNTDVSISLVTVRIDGRSIDFQLPMGSDTSILDAAMQQGADLPYACKGGVCCTCKARLIKGEVRMDVSWGLEPQEISQGWILTCQSHVVSPEVEVDFDVK